MAAQPVAQTTYSLTLYDIEDTLQALANSIDPAQGISDHAAILEEIGHALRRAKDKRDAVVAFLRHCQSQVTFADAEIARLEKRKAAIARVQAELEAYVTCVVERYALPDRRGVKRLEGNFSSLRIQKNPESVVITDLEAIPAAFKHVAVTLGAYVWEALLQNLDADWRKTLEGHVAKLEFKPDKKAIGAELKNGTQIPGADLKFGDWRLVIS